jgi:hypothetical protein
MRSENIERIRIALQFTSIGRIDLQAGLEDAEHEKEGRTRTEAPRFKASGRLVGASHREDVGKARSACTGCSAFQKHEARDS